MQEKEIDQNRNRNLLSKVFNLLEIFEITEQELLLDSLLSAWTFVYWNMEVLLELLIIEIIFLQSKFTQSAQLLDVFFKSVRCAGVGWYVADSAFLLPELSLATTALSAFLLQCSLAKSHDSFFYLKPNL